MKQKFLQEKVLNSLFVQLSSRDSLQMISSTHAHMCHGSKYWLLQMGFQEIRLIEQKSKTNVYWWFKNV